MFCLMGNYIQTQKNIYYPLEGIIYFNKNYITFID